MPIAPGTYLGGVRDEATLRCRCTVDPIHGCWRWNGRATRRGPKVHLRLANGTNTLVLGRRAAAIIANGCEPLAAGMTAFQAPECPFVDCVWPNHARVGTQTEAMRTASARGCFHSPAHRAALSALQQAARKVTPEQTLEIALGDESTAETAAKYGISKARVLRIRRGDFAPARKPRSVFEWRGSTTSGA